MIGFGGGDRQIATTRHCFTADYTDSTRICSGLTTRYGASSTDPVFVVEQRKAACFTQTIRGVRVRELIRVVFRVNLWSCCCDLAESRAESPRTHGLTRQAQRLSYCLLATMTWRFTRQDARRTFGYKSHSLSGRSTRSCVRRSIHYPDTLSFSTCGTPS